LLLAKQGLVIPHGMNERQLQDVRELARICNKADSIELKLNKSMLEKRPEADSNDFLWYEQGKLVGFLALYHFVPKEAEVGGMVHPEHRRQGIFSALTKAAIESAKAQGVPALKFVCPHQSASAQAFLRANKTIYSFSEFGMRLVEQVTPAGDEQPRVALRLGKLAQRELMIRMDSMGFESPEEDSIAIVDMILSNHAEDLPYIAYNDRLEPVGRINTHIRDGNAHFFGFSVLPEHRRKGYGQQILHTAIQLASEQGLRSMTLEVACHNRKALTLYHQCGFKEHYVNDYYTLTL
jgi:ribosomal protein S18 acetylase RimI-like enzyme